MNWIVNKEFSSAHSLHIAVGNLELNDVVEFIKNELPNFNEYASLNYSTVVFEMDFIKSSRVCILHIWRKRTIQDIEETEWFLSASKSSFLDIDIYKDEFGWIVFELNGDLYECHF